MTTIAANCERMASDSQWTIGSIPGRAKKLYRVRDAIIGICGAVEDGLLFVNWYERRCPEDNKPDLRESEFGAVVLTPDGIFSYYSKLVPIPEYDDAFAMGNGEQTAFAALRAGFSPEEAVEMAASVDIYTGLPVQVEVLGGNED